jgi:hypothetical protein
MTISDFVEVTVTGNQLRNSIKEWTKIRDASLELLKCGHKGSQEFDQRQLVFQYEEADQAIAELQEAQQKYNLSIEAHIPAGSRTLCHLVKAVGGKKRGRNLWDSISDSDMTALRDTEIKDYFKAMTEANNLSLPMALNSTWLR